MEIQCTDNILEMMTEPTSTKKLLRFSNYDELIVLDSDTYNGVGDSPSPLPDPKPTFAALPTINENGEPTAPSTYKDDDLRSLALITSLKLPWNVREPRHQGYWDDFAATKDPLVSRIVMFSTEIGPVFVNRASEGEPIRIGDIYTAIQEKLESPITDNTSPSRHKSLDIKGRLCRWGHSRYDDVKRCVKFIDLLGDRCILSNITPYNATPDSDAAIHWDIIFRALPTAEVTDAVLQDN